MTLDDDVFEASRAQAQASDKKLGEVISQLARRGLRASAQTAKKSGLPTFRVRPDAEINSQQPREGTARRRCDVKAAFPVVLALPGRVVSHSRYAERSDCVGGGFLAGGDGASGRSARGDAVGVIGSSST